MDYLLNLVVSGIIIGSLYGIIAMGFAVIYRATGMVNFAQGELMMLTAYIAYALQIELDTGFVSTLLATVLIAMAVGAALERLFIRPMLGEPMFSRVLVTIGLAVVIRSLVIIAWGAEARPFPAALPSDLIHIGPVSLYPAQVFVVASMAFLAFGSWLFFKFSRIGIAMRATANSESTALLMGINVPRLYAVAWGISGVFAAFAGLSFALMFSLEPSMAYMGLRAFPATILGGLDSVVGGASAGIIIGVVENLVGGYLGRGLKEIAGFALIVAVLMVRPYGMFGQREIERV
ncbi:MAG: branched-chain amino acid ABC transporter permease [Proteobacteria bacterium]|nr:MAG: branched-chain amino acid ABC transporter permease [Pseudomonadota bacterium]